MGLQAILQAHYVNYAQAETIEDKTERVKQKNMRRTRVTFIDTNMDKEKNFFMGRYANMFKLTRYRYFDANEYDYLEDIEWIDPIQQDQQYVHLCRDGEPENFIDIEVEFIKGELESDGVRRYLESVSDIERGNEWVKNSKLTIAICLPKTHEAVAASLYMPIEVYENQQLQQILVYQREASTIIENISKETKKNSIRYEKLRPFGMIYGNYMDDRTRYWKGVLTNAVYNATKNNKPLIYANLSQSHLALSQALRSFARLSAVLTTRASSRLAHGLSHFVSLAPRSLRRD